MNVRFVGAAPLDCVATIVKGSGRGPVTARRSFATGVRNPSPSQTLKLTHYPVPLPARCSTGGYRRSKRSISSMAGSAANMHSV